MNFFKLILCLSLYFLAALPGASGQQYYITNPGSILSPSAQHNLIFSGAIGGSRTLSKTRAYHVAYSPLKYLGVQGTYSKTKVNYSFDSPRGTNTSSYGGAIGGYYFINLKEQPHLHQKKIGVLFDAYLGYEKGNIDNTYNETESSKLNYNKGYIQLGANLSGGVLGLQLKGTIGYFDFVNGSYTAPNLTLPSNQLDEILEKDIHNFSEMTLALNMGIKYGRIYCSQTLLHLFGDNDLPAIDNAYHFGIILEIDKLIKKNNSPKTLENHD